MAADSKFCNKKLLSYTPLLVLVFMDISILMAELQVLLKLEY